MPDIARIRSWYNQRHTDQGSQSWRPQEAYAVFLDQLGAAAPGRLLDVGCGAGQLLKAAADRGLETVGVDISDVAIDIARKTSPDSEFKVGEGDRLDFPDGHFDYVVCLGALEHFPDMAAAVRDMARVGTENARFCIVVPNVRFIGWWFRKKGTEQQGVKESLQTTAEWKRLFRGAGLDIERIHRDLWHGRRVPIFASKNPLGILRRTARRIGSARVP